jgi:hypothetical protein
MAQMFGEGTREQEKVHVAQISSVCGKRRVCDDGKG